MIAPRKLTLGEEIFLEIDKNEYLNELFQKLLFSYSLKLFGNDFNDLTSKEVKDLLRFADLLSKSNDTNNAGKHKVWAQEIIALLNELYPEDINIKLFTHSVLSNCTNYYALEKKQLPFSNLGFFDDLEDGLRRDYLKVPYHDNEHFFADQKEIFNNLENGNYSYSAPTSMGKSFIMRVFIRHKIETGDTSNYAILVPTKALINEVRRKIIAELDKLLSEKNYRVVTSVGDIVLEQEHHFIFIMTPERLLYLTNTFPKLDVAYLFIDEAHKICVKDSRSAFYYQLVDMLSKRQHKTQIYFSSPNIPNPEIYKDLIPSHQLEKTRTQYAPVSQFKFLFDSDSHLIKVYNEYTKKFTQIDSYPSDYSLTDLINQVSGEKQTIVYCSSLADAVTEARTYSDSISSITVDNELLSIAEDVKNQIHDDYYLVDLLKKSIAFHVGYLPSSIKLRIEDAFIKGKIKVIFCTSTLIEGVNLPADNLIITSYKNGNKNLDPVSFRNLIGRVGRLEFSAFGNVFLYRYKNTQTIQKFEELLTEPIPDQKLSIETAIKPKHKKAILDSLANGDIELTLRPKTTEEEYQFMRKVSMLLIDNVLSDNTSSLVVNSIVAHGNSNTLGKIATKFKNEPKSEGLDITYDQYKNLRDAIENGLEYPPQVMFNGRPSIDFKATKPFLEKLYTIFKWDVYESEYLAMQKLLPYYASILNQWMSGYGLKSIMSYSIEHKRQNPLEGIYSKHRKIVDEYDYKNRDHRNLVFAEVLNLLEHMILYSISNYFRVFSTEYKRQHNIADHFDNDWYEYVEYGTMSSSMIDLQRVGYSRESATFILNQKKKFIDESIKTTTAPFVLRKQELMNCTDKGVKMETQDISINVPELFI